MSILSKIKSMLIEEVEPEVIADDKLVDISFPEEEILKAKQEETMQKPKEELQQPIPTHNRTQEIAPEKVKEETRKFVSIEIGKEEEKPKETRNSAVYTRGNRLNSERVEKSEFEVTPVISPIFGSKDENAMTKGSAVSITLPKPKKQNPLGTVISPYYGNGELEEFKAEAQENIQQKEKKRQSETIIEDTAITNEDKDEEDINALSLDDLIMDNDQEDDEDDMMQISLFGESTPLRESDEEVDSIQEEV